MRRVICVITAMLICLSMASPVFAAEEFVPSIGYKDHPEIVPGKDGSIAQLIDKNGQIIDLIWEGCLIVTPVANVETSTEIPEDSRVILRDVYKALSDGSMTIPFENPDGMVIRDLFDASLICTDGHKERLAEEGVCISITFDLGIGAYTDVYVMTYNDGVWNSIVSTVNNGDGTVTCVFEHLCPIVFAVREGSDKPPAQTGDPIGANLILWVVLMVASAAALVTVIAIRRKEAR